MRGRPPRTARTAEHERAAAAFVEGAEAARPPDRGGEGPARTRRAPRTDPGQDERPWEAARVRDDVVKGYALRLPEPLYLKLKYVAEQTGRSMNTVCREAVEAEVEAAIRQIDP